MHHRAVNILSFSLATLIFVTILSCGKKEEAQTPAAGQQSSKPIDANHRRSTKVNVAGITFQPPDNWYELGPSGQRAANYVLPPDDDAEARDSVTITASYFGPNGAGTVEANMARWISQMIKPDGSAPEGKKDTMSVEGIHVSTLEVAGTYLMPIGGMMSGKTEPKSEFYMAAAVVEAPGGTVYFKMTGPEKAARSQLSGFYDMIRGIHKN